MQTVDVFIRWIQHLSQGSLQSYLRCGSLHQEQVDNIKKSGLLNEVRLDQCTRHHVV